jgi:KaiC/GvpD/RAD55 family RecA-like ATPase
MAGGTRVGDANLIMGPSGVGKTIFGLRWTAQELEQGRRCLYVTFQDTADQLSGMASTFGWDFEAARASGHLAIAHVPMGDLDLDVLADTIRAELAEHPVSRVVIDSLAELVFAAREWERFPAYMRSLIGLIRAAGSSALLTSETTANGIALQSLDELMFLFDNVIDLRYIEQEAQVGRSLNVVKMRNSPHQMTLNSFAITDHGIVVGDRLIGVTGRLGWSALRVQDQPDSAQAAVPAPAQSSLCLLPVPVSRLRVRRGGPRKHACCRCRSAGCGSGAAGRVSGEEDADPGVGELLELGGGEAISHAEHGPVLRYRQDQVGEVAGGQQGVVQLQQAAPGKIGEG